MIEQEKPYEDYRICSYKPRKELEPILYIKNIPVLTRSNFSVISGIAKVGKTFLLSAIASALTSGNWEGVITAVKNKTGWFDTEQAEAHAGQVYDRVAKMTGIKDPFDMFALRGCDPDEMIKIIRVYIEQTGVDFLFIDGIADLMLNPNDIDKSIEIQNLLMNITAEYNMHICCVLHVNYDSPKLRGHLGSNLERKCEHAIILEKETEGIKVSAKLMRGAKAYEPFTFFIEDDVPVCSDVIPTGFTPIKNVVSENYYEKEQEDYPF